MAQGTRIGSAVTFVQELDRSVDFYRDVLGLRVADSSPTAALLASDGGSQLILRAMGSNATHALGSVGVQYVVWEAPDPEYLDRCERQLKQRSAHRETREDGGSRAVEGSDPDGIAVMVVYPGPDNGQPRRLPTRIYGW
jgi:catechol 2,3-dioxygenase-like lactoylglutathione lyase family enzyme